MKKVSFVFVLAAGLLVLGAISAQARLAANGTSLNGESLNGTAMTGAPSTGAVNGIVLHAAH